MINKIYFVSCEVNDKGWHKGYNYFASREHAVKLMRNHVAYLIRNARENRKEVFLRKDSLSIFLRIDEDTFDFRICCSDIKYSELPKDRCFNY